MDPTQVGSVKRTPASEKFLGEKGKKIVLKDFVIMGDSQQDCVPFAQNRKRSKLTCLGEVVLRPESENLFPLA